MDTDDGAINPLVRSVGASPGTLCIPPGAKPSRITAVRYDPGSIDVRSDVAVEDLAGLVPERGVLWVDVSGMGTLAVLQRLVVDFGIPFLALEDALNAPQRAKVDPYDDGRFLVLRIVDVPGRLDLDQLAVWIRGNVVFTFQHRPGDCFDPLRRRLQIADSQIRQRGADYLAYRLVDSSVDSFFPELDRLADRLEELETAAVDRPSSGLLQDIYQVRRDLHVLERVSLPMRDAISAMARDEEHFFAPQTRPYLRDVDDHMRQVVEQLAHHNALAADIRELVLGALDLRMNQAMRVLAAVTVVFMPLTFVVGIYGMNFETMPELRWTWGYPAVLGTLLLVGVATFLVLHRRGWTRLDS